MAIVFPNEGKAVNYFIQFTKYQNQICWDDHFLQKVVKDALPLCMRDKLRFSHENVLFFKGLKRAILRINNNYWKHQLENKNKSQTTCTLQIYPSKNLCLNPSRPSSTPERITNSDRWSQKGPRSLFPLLPTHPENLPLLGSNILGLDGQLTLVEWQHYLLLGLCMYCGQTGHLAWACPRQSIRNLMLVEGHTVKPKIYSGLKLTKFCKFTPQEAKLR